MSDKKVPAAEIRDRVRAWRELSDEEKIRLAAEVTKRARRGDNQQGQDKRDA